MWRRLRSQNHSRLLFIGDSDTRGLVFQLLQQLSVVGARSVAAAAAAPERWIGRQVLNGTVRTAILRELAHTNASRAAMDAAVGADWARRCVGRQGRAQNPNPLQGD
jgi:hypothetical protein